MSRWALVTMLVCCCGVADAQLFQQGPDGSVRINAPFVRVEVGPAGETYVRAPFTRVATPGRWPGHPVAYSPFAPAPVVAAPVQSQPAIVTSPQWEQASWRQRRMQLRAAGRAFIAELSQMADGSIWRDYLQPDLAVSLVADDSDQPPNARESEQFLALAKTYDATLANRELRWITSLPSFRQLHEGLHVFASAAASGSVPASARAVSAAEPVGPANASLGQQLATSATRLDRDLRQFASAAGFRGYLELPLEIYAGGDAPDAAPDLAQLELMLERYDRVADAREYREVTRLASFVSTRDLLAQYIASLRDRPAIELVPTPAERLPEPGEPAP